MRNVYSLLVMLLFITYLSAAEFSIVGKNGTIARTAGEKVRLLCRSEKNTSIAFNKRLSGNFQAEVVIDRLVVGQGGFSVRMVTEDAGKKVNAVMAYFIRDPYGSGCIYLAARGSDGQTRYFSRQNKWQKKWDRSSLLWAKNQKIKLAFARQDGKLKIQVYCGKYALATSEISVSNDSQWQLLLGDSNGVNGGQAQFTIHSVSINNAPVNLADSTTPLPLARNFDGLPFSGRFEFPGGEGFLQLPDKFDPKKRYPLIIFFHGRGGNAVFSNFNNSEFTSFAKLCSERGFIVAVPDYGSDSWFNQKAENISLKMLEYLQNKLPVDSKEIFAMGCSMGGASALIFTARHPDKIRAVCDIFGITDYLDFYVEAKKIRKSLASAYDGTPEANKEYYTARSAVEHIDVLKTKPIMIIHGRGDNVVPQKHSDTLVRLLREKGGKVNYHVVPGIGHENRIVKGLESAILNFFKKPVNFSEHRKDEPECFKVMAETPKTDNDLFIPVVDGGFFRHFKNSFKVPWVISTYDSNTELTERSVYPVPFPTLSLNAFATQGEYTFLTFAIQTRKIVKDFKFELSTLVGDDGSKLRLKQAKLFLVDSKEFLLDPKPGVVPAKKLFAMALLLSAPEDTATVYRGSLRISGSGQQILLPINFAVLPITLPEADIAFGAYLPGHPSDLGAAWGRKWGAKDYTAHRIPAYFRFWKTRNLNSPTLYHLSPTVIGSGQHFRQDFSVIDLMANAMKKNKLRGPMIIDTRFYARWANGAAKRTEYQGTTDVELFIMSMKQLLQYANKAQWPAWLCTPEEEIGNGGEKLTFYEKYWKPLRKAVGQEHEIIIDNDIGQGRKNAIDRGERDHFKRRQYNSWTEAGLAAAKRDGAEVWSYNYGWKRNAFGLLQLRLDSHGHHQWADQWTLGGKWYVTLLTDDGIVSSLKMERAHEGVNDYRTAQWLRAVNPNQAKKLIPQLVSDIPIQRAKAYHFSSNTPDREFMLARWRMLLAGKPKLANNAAAPGKARFGVTEITIPQLKKGSGQLNTTAKFMSKTPRIDGAFDAAWESVKMSASFRRTRNFETHARAFAATDTQYRKMITASYTSFGAAYSQAGLLFKLMVNHSTPEQISNFGNDDGGLWKHDCVEFFFDIPGGGFFHLITNARGNRTLIRNGTVVSSRGIIIKTKSPINPSGGYAQEILIPWTRLGLVRMPEDGTVWNFNVGREYHTGKLISSWAQVDNDFAERHNYGSLYFGADNGNILQLTSRPEVLCGKNCIQGKLNIKRTKNFRTLRLLDANGRMKASVNVNSKGKFSLDFFVPPADRAQIFKLELVGMPEVMEKFIIQPAPSLAFIARKEYFVITGGELTFPISFLVSEKTRRNNLLIATFKRNGKEAFRLETPAVGGHEAICSFVLDGVAPGRYELSFALADGATKFSDQTPLIIQVLESPYVRN